MSTPTTLLALGKAVDGDNAETYLTVTLAAALDILDGAITVTSTQTLSNKTLTSPVLTTPKINDASATNTYALAVNELAADRTITLPLLAADDTFVFANFVQTLVGKTLTSPTINGGTHTALTTLGIRSTGAAFDATIAVTEVLTAARTLTLVLNDAARTLNLGGNFVLAGGSLTLTLGGATNVTLPTTGTLATLAGAEALSNKTLTSPTVTGGTFSSPALTTPKVTTSINDSGGNEVIKTPATASAVNEVTITNAATGSAPQISATGDDTDINLKLKAKGAGQVQVSSGTFGDIQTYSPAGAGTATLDLSLGDIHHITMPAGNITIALSNAKAGQVFLVRILQDSGGSRTVTWFTTIRWAGGVAPTLTTTASKVDTVAFEVTGVGTYDGFIVGQNV